MELHPGYSHIDTEGIDIQEENEKQVSSIYRKIDIPDMKELKENTALLDPFQRRVIGIRIQYAKEIKKAEKKETPTQTHLTLWSMGEQDQEKHL